MKQASTTNKSITIWAIGFALFSMFFGSGNLVFPLIIGEQVGSHIFSALVGLVLTAVLFPLLGLYGMTLYDGNVREFFERIGKIPGFCAELVLYLLLGPFGVIPRLLTLMHSNLEMLFPWLSLPAFTLVSCVAIYVCCVKDRRMIQILGYILTPMLILGLLVLIGLGIFGNKVAVLSSLSAGESFQLGFVGGYNMMDLLAAFLFAGALIPVISAGSMDVPKAKRSAAIGKTLIGAGLIAAALLGLIYAGLCYLGAHYDVHGIAPQNRLSHIAGHVIGYQGSIVAIITVVLACLTTAIALVSIFSHFLQGEILRSKVKFNVALMISLLASAVMAQGGFGGICLLLAPILNVIYPGLILLCLLNILHKTHGLKSVKLPVYALFIAMLAYTIWKA